MSWPAGLTARWRRRFSAAAIVVVVLSILGGCATQTAQLRAHTPSDLPVRVELADTPFFPDDSYYCGPAALATSLTSAGFPVELEPLIDELFLPARKGTLQVEMLAAARRHGAVATVIPDNMEALLREVAAGHPVVVLQNLGLSWYPVWHYAVVVAYDLEDGYLLLRSGPMKREEFTFRTFEHTWNRSQRWAFVTLPPGSLPRTATEVEAVRALVAFERRAPPADAIRAYRSGLERWPENATLSMGLGNSLYASGNKAGAEEAFRRAAEKHALAAAFNNQARVLLELGRRGDARKAAQRGLEVAGPERQALLETLDAIDSVPGT